jgi:AcrR family transcriptional regulator
MAKRGELARRAPEARRQAIIEAALSVFVAQGFAAAKLDDVADKAGVAKGTIYLYFKDKQDLFEQMVRAAVSPVIERLEALAKVPDLPSETALKSL